MDVQYQITSEIQSKTSGNFNSNTISKKMFLYYFLIIVIGTLLLLTPWALTSYTKTNGENFTLIDAIFTASSAFSDTGLVVTATADQFTKFGQGIILFLIQVGGIGFLTLKVLLWMFLGKKIGLKEKMLLNSERGSAKLGSTVELIKTAIAVIFVLQLLGIIVLTTYFFFVDIPETSNYKNFGESLWHGIFHSISAINNAGFDITGGNSLAPYSSHYFIQIFIMFLFISGGVGFPVIYDVRCWIRSKRKNSEVRFKFSLFTKLSMMAYISVALIGLGLAFTFEMLQPAIVNGEVSYWHNPAISQGDKIMGLIFNTFSTRNAGFATMDLAQLSDPTLFVYSLMMFIGSAPASTAGGIRTTTIAICFLTIKMVAKGKDKVRVYGKEIHNKIVINALVVFFLAFLLVAGATFAVMMFMVQLSSHADVSFITIWFEIASAFGTTGLSLGITPDLTPMSQITIIIVMFIGQLGVSGTLLVWISSDNKLHDTYSLPEEDVIIG